VSSEEVTRAHLDRIEEVDRRVRAFTVVLRHEAIAAARRADEERRRGEARGPLHGLPFSVKESLDVAGQASTLGVPSRRDTLATNDSAIVRMIREAGGVIVGRTNVSQLLLFHESRNALFGQTANPWSLAHTPGGSSGGEAAALAAGMSALGVGTDIGGSIRVPAHFSGIAGLKPTLDRWPNLGANGAIAGQEVIRAQIGPMARSARDLTMLMRALDPARMSALDPRVPPVPFEDPARIDVGRLRVGHYGSDGIIPSSHAVERAVRSAAAVLRSRGAQVFEWIPPDLEDAVYGYFAALSADGGATAWAVLGKAEPDLSLKSMRTAAHLGDRARRALARAAGLAGEKRFRRMLEVMGEKSVAALWRWTHTLRSYRVRLLAAMDSAGIDVLLCPAHATPALPHGGSRDFALAGSPSMLWNLVQFPAGVVPVTRVRPDETRRDRPRDRLEKRAAEVDRQSAGLPVGVQVVGRPWAEDVVLAVMTAIEEGLDEQIRPRTPVEIQ
jgi:fatty acid amide hydrolase